MNESICVCHRCGYENVLYSVTDDLVARIARTAGALWAVDPDTILSRSQRKRVVAARAAVCAVMRNNLGMTYPDIGATLGRDHTTVMHAVRTCDPEMMVQLADACAEFLPAL